jgi:hypothetical protein
MDWAPAKPQTQVFKPQRLTDKELEERKSRASDLLPTPTKDGHPPFSLTTRRETVMQLFLKRGLFYYVLCLPPSVYQSCPSLDKQLETAYDAEHNVSCSLTASEMVSSWLLPPYCMTEKYTPLPEEAKLGFDFAHWDGQLFVKLVA